ncbi:hypothetical protein K438DRAFT_1773917 [Mycena galopus ATCC 62051]|nr:hypothetical protein K438DRAFT_1773917 [Mycena galopus ATCC 62051]
MYSTYALTGSQWLGPTDDCVWVPALDWPEGLDPPPDPEAAPVTTVGERTLRAPDMVGGQPAPQPPTPQLWRGTAKDADMTDAEPAPLAPQTAPQLAPKDGELLGDGATAAPSGGDATASSNEA